MEETTEAFPGISHWERFDDACQEAMAVRNRAIELATSERDQVVNMLPGWKVHVPERIRRAAQARYDDKVKTAQDDYDAAVEHAQMMLMAALDGRSAPS